MKKPYDHAAIEEKWRKRWSESDIYRTVEDPTREKVYVLDMFPYPSGEGLHVGHPKGYIATDIYSRTQRMKGKSVLHPMGWDAFGLPAENFALKHKVHPRIAVEKNIARFKEQLALLGFNYDWSREINTTDPAYYKWTQWIFLQLFKRGLAYQSHEPINWCPSCMTGLANEDLDGAACERCGTTVQKRALPQWVLKITAYADRMLKDLDTLKWPEHIKEAQRNWIGRTEGVEIDFHIRDSDEKVTVFTTRADTLFGATFLVLAPEHPLVETLRSRIKNWDETIRYIVQARQKTEIERTAAEKEKTGVKLHGVMAINPVNKEAIPIFIADYVLANYGTGAIMAVPAHDERDCAFAKISGLEVRQVIATEQQLPYAGEGWLINSGTFNGIPSAEAKRRIAAAVSGRTRVTYKIRDWVFSRQRYWGEPIPVIHCETCGVVPVPEEDLPVLLPDVDSYEPSGTGESPLANIAEWVNTTCPRCKGPGKRETNTMPQWAGSSWYYLRFMDPHNTKALVGKAKEKYWAPVDVYVGGDHAVRHLIYARFWHKFLHDIGIVSTEEPFARLEFLGFILAADGKKMSKRLGNIINPDDVVRKYGADAFRLYEMFMGPFENTTAWNEQNLIGVHRFVERVVALSELVQKGSVAGLETILHQTIQKVGDDIESFKFNTAVSQFMIFLNAAEEAGSIGEEQWATFLRLLAPFAPHLTEELWEMAGNVESIHLAQWPEPDEGVLKAAQADIAVQINGKVRGIFRAPFTISEAEALAKARALPEVQRWLAGKKEMRAIYVPGRLVSLVTADI